jgi:NAD(P)-dependent dehydrogenase (short-subunit alcohol dehydrogenase family)
MNRLAGKVAVITGAGSGIGRASAKRFVAEGTKVVVAELDAALGEARARPAPAPASCART